MISVDKKAFIKSKKSKIFLIGRNFLAPQKKIFKYCLRYWKRKIKLIKLRFSKRANILLADFKDKIKKEAYILKGKRLSLAFRPFLFLQRTAVFALTLCILFTAVWFVLPKPQISQSRIIKTTLIKQASPVVAGQTVKWSVIVKKSDITNEQNLVQLPKSAKNIKVKIVNKQGLGPKLLFYEEDFLVYEEFNGWKVPEVLLSGDHKKIKNWRGN